MAEDFVGREGKVEKEDNADGLLRFRLLLHLHRLLALFLTSFLRSHALEVHQRVLRAQRVQLLPFTLSSSFPTSIFSSSKSSSKLSTNSGPAEYSRSSSSIDASRDKHPPRGDSGALSSRGEYSDAEDAARFPEMYMFTRESERGIVVRDLRSIPAGTPTADSA